MFYGSSPGSEPSFSSAITSSAWGFEPVQDDFQHHFTSMTDKANGSVILAKLYVLLFRECNNQRLSPWGRPFSCFPDLDTDLCQNINHGFHACLNKFCWNIINSCRLPLFQCSYCDLNFLPKDWL